MDIKRIGVRQKSSEIVIYNGVAYLTGKVCADEDMDKDFETQVESTLRNLDRMLDKIGSTRHDLLTTTVYFRDITNINKFNEIWNKWLPEGAAPARNCVQAYMTDERYLIEVTAEIAVRQ